MAFSLRNKDFATDVLLHLPLHSIMRCKLVCKLWCDLIDSPSFRKLHNEDDEYAKDGKTIFLQINFNFLSTGDFKVSIKVLDDDDEPLNIKHGFTEEFPTPRLSLCKESVRIDRAVKGLICFNFMRYERLIAICNPILGQIKTLPPFTSNAQTTPCRIFSRDIAIGFDSDCDCDCDPDYKVVELVYCVRHRCLHVHLYSRRTDSWRELGDQRLRIMKAVQTTSRHGRFAHWLACRRVEGNYEEIILTFDMKNVVFRTVTTTPDSRSMVSCLEQTVVVAKDDDRSFSLIILPDDVSYGDKLVRIYDSSTYKCEGSSNGELNWYDGVKVELPQPARGGQVWRRGCVALKVYSAKSEPLLFIYDYRARKFIGCVGMPMRNCDVFAYRGTFISPP